MSRLFGISGKLNLNLTRRLSKATSQPDDGSIEIDVALVRAQGAFALGLDNDQLVHGLWGLGLHVYPDLHVSP